MKILSDPSSLERNILDPGFLNYQEYAEIKLLEPGVADGSNRCNRCQRELVPLTYLDPDFFYQPCQGCLNCMRKSERQYTIDSIFRNIKEFYYSKVLSDRYLQLFIIDRIYFRNTIPHNYSVFRNIIKHLSLPNKGDLWFLDWLPGFPKIISLENLDGLCLTNLSRDHKIENKSDKIIIDNEYEIIFPELVTYDSKHHSRYSLFNKTKAIKTKRLKIGDKCVKFYNTEKLNIKSIFHILKNGEEFNVSSLKKQDFALIKLSIFRNKQCLRLIFEIVMEVLKVCNTFKDTVFLQNTVALDPKKEKTFNLLWTIKSYENLVSDSSINISII